MVPGQSRSQGSGKGGLKKVDHSQIISICALATKELGIPPDNCLRCGLPSHQANSCRHTQIFKQKERCDRCGRLRTGGEHKCQSKSFKCGRCKRNGHLSGVCRKVINNDSMTSTTQANMSTVATEISDGSELKIIHSSVACASSRTALHDIVGSLPADPVVNLVAGHDAPKTYCPIQGLVDS
ncbi:hypothetical protein Pmar_PMAR011030, partial [Perkinsus marinus ATCC 50983]